MVIGMTPSATPLRQLIENRLSQLTAETETLFADARERARRETADQLNQAVRRIRQADGPDELCATLAAAAGGFASGILVFRVDGDVARSEKAEIALSSAAALRGAIETRDPVIAAATASEISAPLLDLLGHPADGRVFIFPVVVNEDVPALLCAWGGVEGSSVELLTQVAADFWKPETPPTPEPAPAVELLQIAPVAVPAASSVPGFTWESLPLEEQRIHLRAQRFARVQVSEVRLFSTDQVRAGREQHDLYAELRAPIEKAR